MINVARRDHPHVRFEVCSMTDLDLPAGSLAGILAWQSLIHIPDGDVPTILQHFHRALQSGGSLQLLFHVGEESQLMTEGYGGHPMKLYVHRRQPERVGAWLRDAGSKSRPRCCSSRTVRPRKRFSSPAARLNGRPEKIRAYAPVSQISWRTSAAHQSTEDNGPQQVSSVG